MCFFVLASLASFMITALASPAPTPIVLDKRAATTTYTIEAGFTGIPKSAANPAGCVNVDFGAGDTRNDLIDGECKNLTLIFARGTSEMGNIGSIVGPPFVDALTSKLGVAQVAVQGVNNYPADVAGFNEGGSPTGSMNMAMLIAQAMSQCPKTKLCVSGYSQGAQVAHNAADMITAAQTHFINSVVLYGDPDLGEAFGKVDPNRVSTDCHIGDDICLHGNLVLPPHLDYCLDVDQEAAFVIMQSGLQPA